MCLDSQASRNLAAISILYPIGRKIVYPGFLKALERACNLVLRTTGGIVSAKAMTRFFLPVNQCLVNLYKIAIRKESQEVEAFHTMISLNVDRTLGAELNIGNTTPLAGLKGNREKFVTRHARLEDPQLRGLRQDRGLFDRTHGELEHDLQRAETTTRMIVRDLRSAVWVRVRPEGLHQLVVSSVEYRYITCLTAPLLLVDGPLMAGWAQAISSLLDL